MKYPEKESSKLEFKETLPQNTQIMKTVIGFCNMYGGKLIIGVADNRDIVGIPEKKVHEALETLSHNIYQDCAPPIIPQIYQQLIDDKYIIVIEVSSGMQKPYYKKSAGLDQGTYVRLGRSTVKANADLIEELKLQTRGKTYDQTPVYHASPDDLDKEKIEAFISERRNGTKVKLTDDLLKSYDITTAQHAHEYPTICGMLLFGKNPQHFLTENYILCSHFKGIQGREAIASQVCNGSIFEQFDVAYEFIISRLHKAYSIKGKRREETLEVPPIAIREALMNALLHRNYHIKSPIKVAIYQNRVEIFSPGTFPGPIDTDYLESGITYTRNVAMAKILWEFKYVEKMGSGLITIFESCKDAGLARPEITEGTNSVKCIIYREECAATANTHTNQLLRLFEEFDELSAVEIAKELDMPKTSLLRMLNDLLDQGIIVRIGQTRNTRYRLK